MNFDFLVKFIEQIKDLSCKRAAGLVLSMVIMLSVYKIDTIMPYVDQYITPKEPPKATKGILYSSVDLDIKDEHIDMVTSYLEQYATPYVKDFAFISIYKYIPEGPDYSYQGRILVQSKFHPTLADTRTLKELNLGWVPLWSGRNVTEHLFDNQTVLVSYDATVKGFVITKPPQDKITPHQLHSVNTDILFDLGIRYIIYQPIKYGDRIVGYVAIYLTALDTKYDSLVEMARSLGSRVGRYLVED